MSSPLFSLAGHAFGLHGTLVLGAGLSALALGIVTAVTERRETESLPFLLLTGSVAMWLVSYAFMGTAPTDEAASRWARAGHLGIPFIAPGLYQFTVDLLGLEERRRPVVGSLWLVAGLVAGLAVGTRLVVAGFTTYGWGRYPAYGPLGAAVWGLVSVGVALALAELGAAYRRQTRGPQRQRTLAFLAALTLAAPATIDFLPSYGVDVRAVGWVFILLFIGVAAATIRRLRFVDYTPAFAAPEILATMDDALLVCDAEGTVRTVNPAAERLAGRSSGQLVGEALSTLLRTPGEPEGDGLPGVEDGIRDREMELLTARGETIPVSVSTSPLRDRVDEVVGIVVLARDVRERKATEVALRRSEEKFQKAFHVTPMAAAIATVEEERFLEVNEGFVEFFEVAREEALGATGEELGIWRSPEEWTRVQERIRASGKVEGMEVRMSTRRGEPKDVLFFGEVIELEGRDCLLGLVVDITQRKLFERQLERQALYDELTGLANRTLLQDRIEHALARAAREGGKVGLLSVDLDDFMRVNDSLGHGAGDEALVTVARRLEDLFREEDTVARIGGDEFYVLLEEVGSPTEAAGAAKRILRMLDDPVIVGETPVQLAASVGVVVESGRGGAGDLLRFSDVALSRAKVDEETGIHVFDPRHDSIATRRVQRENELRVGIEEGQIRVAYQPIVDLRSGRIEALEALARWEHPERGIVPPADFVPLAEKSDLIGVLGRRVMELALRQASRWREEGSDTVAGIELSDLRLSLNLSPREFHDPDLPRRIEEALTELAFDPDHVVLEITESAAMHRRERLEELRERGLHVAMDDFGTGYSSLAYLETLAVDYLKIDRSFVSGLERDPPDDALVRTILRLGEILGLTVIAEGVETPRQLEALRRLGCAFAQGFHLAEPMFPEELESWVARNGRRVSLQRDG